MDMQSLIARVLALSLLVLASGFASSSIAAELRKVNVDDNDVAIMGYDTVAYFVLGKPTKGDPKYESLWNEARWFFASAEHRDLFRQDPERYSPRFGGFCAMGLALGYLAIADPEVWTIVDGKLYLNHSEKGRAELHEDIPGALAKAEHNWKELGQQ
jgi:YHS domain-containing protein